MTESVVPLRRAREIRAACKTYVIDLEHMGISRDDVGFLASRAFVYGSNRKILRLGRQANLGLDLVVKRGLDEDGNETLTCPWGVFVLMRDFTLADDEMLVDDPTQDPATCEQAFMVVRGADCVPF